MRSGESIGGARRRWEAVAGDRYAIRPGGDSAVDVKAATEACRAQRLQEVRHTISCEYPGQSGTMTTSDALALGLLERSSRGLVQSSNMAEQLRRTTGLNHADLAMNRALHQVKTQCWTAGQKLREDQAAVRRQQGINLTLRHQLRAKQQLLNNTKRADDKSAMYQLHHNEAWTARKMKKNSEHAKLWRLTDQMWTLEKRIVHDRQARERHVGQGTQELARLQTLVAASRSQLSALQDQIRIEREAIAQICSARDMDAADERFGIFASADGLATGLDALSVDIQSIHSMDPEARGFALAHLSDRFDQLRSLSRHMRKVVTTAASVYDTLDLSDTLDAINEAATELLDTAQARVLLLDAEETYLWYPQPDASGDEDSEAHLRFPVSPCITTAALQARQLLAVVNPASHPEYEETLDAAASTVPHALLVCPIMHPVMPQQPIGVLQCFDKRSRDGAFTDADLLTAKLLCLYAAAAAINASRYDSDYRCRLLSRRSAELTCDIAAERDILELPAMITARAKELLSSQRARLYFLPSPLTPAVKDGSVNLQPLSTLVGGGGVPSNKAPNPMNPQPAQPCELERMVALTASPAVATPHNKPCGYDDSFDRENDFEAAHIACVPLIGDTGETIGVLTVMRGWSLNAPPAQNVIWSDSRYAPFPRFETSALQSFAGVCAVAVQGAMLQQRVQHLPRWTGFITSTLSMDQALTTCHQQLAHSCPAEAVQIVFPLAGNESWAWSQTEGVTRQPISGLLSHVIATGIPQRAGPISEIRHSSGKVDADQDQAVLATDPCHTISSDDQARCTLDLTDRSGATDNQQDQPASARKFDQCRATPEEDGHAAVLRVRHAASGTAEDAARLFRAESDSIGRINPQFLLLVPIVDMQNRRTAPGRAGAEVIAVLKLINKTGSQEGMFSFTDEVLVQAMAHNAASALQMAQFAESSFDDENFVTWICETTKELVCCDAVMVHWVDDQGCLPDLNSDPAQTVLSPVTSQDSCSGPVDELFVGIVDASGTGRGVLHLKGSELRKVRYGALKYQESEVRIVREFGKAIGAFLEAAHATSPTLHHARTKVRIQG